MQIIAESIENGNKLGFYLKENAIILENSVECGIIVQACGITVLSKNLSFTHSVKRTFFGSAVESVVCARNRIQLVILGLWARILL